MTEPIDCWPIDTGCLDESWQALTPEVQERATRLAIASLRRLTLGRVGGCPITVRPCSQRAAGHRQPYVQDWMQVQNWGGTWVNCLCGKPCRCETGCEVVLPGYVGRVDAIMVGASALDVSKVKISNHEKIVWQGGGDCPFPKDQDLSKPLGAADTFAITYLPARPVGPMGAWAAGVLAVEFAKACAGTKKCRLPENVVAVTRQGITYNLVPGSFPNGKTGIREVDAYIEIWNPHNARTMPTVWSVDDPEFVVES